MPGRMATRSRPMSRNTGQTKSTSSQAMNSVPSDTFGATGLAASATAKWPMNMLGAEQRLLQVVLHRLVAQPDPEQRAVEILAGDRRAGRLALDHYLRAFAGP